MTTPRTVADISKYQSRFFGDPNNPAHKWDPDVWDTEVIDWDELLLGPSAPEAIIFRTGDGYNLDPCYYRYLEAIVGLGVPWGVYHLFRPQLDPLRQADLLSSWCPPSLLAGAGVWADFEFNGGLVGRPLFDRCNAFLRAVDEAYTIVTGIYSGAWFMNPNFEYGYQRVWANAGRKGWWSGYPTLYIPNAWYDIDPQYVLHQFTDKFNWPGLPKPADASRMHPHITVEQLRKPPLVENPPPWPDPVPPPPAPVPPGSTPQLIRGHLRSIDEALNIDTGVA